MTDTKALEALLEPIATAMGFDLVRVALMNGPGGLTLQVMAEDPATRQLTIDQCASLSRRVSDVLDEADPIPDEYNLEVSSPGIDRPLTRLRDFADWAGYVAKIQLAEPVEGRKRFQGHILGLDDAMVRIAVEGLGEAALPFAGIASAKLVLTDELIKATKPLSSEGADELDEEEEDN
ncbi:ribosome maturation protein RimP [Sphingosinicella microcystinivorans]|uniref:ribosome maturation protein RimP n=1 Tax=Sphingosinicella microcystinivorans TaxID=335406 RepID=UPI0022F3ABE5|nr:ribosome maturation protein RimP [Sphingosinicella microcystinivorans]WBX84826.1 ribosome maturation protein RimP [Sphingosinicella microcystinivorans]